MGRELSALVWVWMGGYQFKAGHFSGEKVLGFRFRKKK
jgi:hypothetical protein